MKKNFNSKNIANKIENLVALGNTALAVDILEAKELKHILPNLLKTLKRKTQKKNEFEQTKIYSKTDIDKNTLKKLEKTLSINLKNTKIIIDESVGVGIKIKVKDKLVDASMETMLESAINKIIL